MHSDALFHTPPRGPDHRKAVLEIAEILAVVVVLALHAGWRVPGVNEPHYLGKARHFWNPGWIEGDFFLNSADAHQTFYFTFGWLSLAFGMQGMAHVGRLIMWTLQAWGWTRLSRAAIERPGWAPWTAALFTMACQHCQMAGEWVIGGLEAKGIAYAFVFFALECVLRRQWQHVWPLLGTATAFHVLVGGWMFAIAAGVWFISIRTASAPRRAWSMLPYIVAGVAIGTIGLFPALRLTWQSPSDVVRQANTIYVYYRLRHHLVPQAFPPVLVARFLLLASVWAFVAWRLRHVAMVRRTGEVVVGSLLIALVGTGIASVAPVAPDWAASWLRFYWFRMADALLPLGAAFAGISAAQRLRAVRPGWGIGLMVLLGALSFWHIGERATASFAAPWPPADAPDKVSDPRAWRDACCWVREHTPHEALFLTPRLAHTFKWWASRAEVVNWKDIPQEASAIVEWWQRIRDVHQADESSSVRYYESLASQPSGRIKQLASRYGATHCITSRTPPLDFPVLYENRSYRVYRIE